MKQPSDYVMLKNNDKIYKYQLEEKIGSGGFGEVWRATDHAINQEYAVKLLRPGTPVDNRLKEARIGHILNHENVVKVHQADVVKVDGHQLVIIAMDYIPGGSIVQKLNPDGFLPLPDAIRTAKDILRGLEYLHGHDFFHNDIKPDNILIGSSGQAMLTDYGITGITSDGAEISATKFYKLHAAPEVISENKMSASTDIYQAGMTLFRLCAGNNILRTKFEARGQGNYYKDVCDGKVILQRDFPDFVPSRLRRIILRATAQCSDARYSSALEMRRELEKLNYSGYWTTQADGSLRGRNGHNEYRFDIEKTNKGHNFSAFKKNIKSGREVRISEFTKKSLNPASLRSVRKTFIKSVVE